MVQHQTVPANLPLIARYPAAVYLAMVLPGVLVARGVNVLFAGLVLAAAIGTLLRWRKLLPAAPARQTANETAWVVYAGLTFAGLAALSSLWSIVPLASLEKGVILAGFVLATAFAMHAARLTDAWTLNQAVTGFVIAASIGAAVLIFEVISDQRLLRWIFETFPALGENHRFLKFQDGKVVFIGIADINRVTCVIAMLLVPAFVGVQGAFESKKVRAALTVLFLALILAIFWRSAHQSSQLALLGGIAVAALALWRPVIARLGVTAGWILLIVAMIPLALWMFKGIELHKESWLFRSAASRVAVWGFTSEKIFENPILGVGARATSTLNDMAIESGNYEEVELSWRTKPLMVHHHAHNVYLQTWFELGAIGALLLLVWGLAALRAIATLPVTEQVPWFSQFTVTALMAATSFGLWQFWFQVTIASALILLWMAALVARDRDSERRKTAP